MKCLKCSCGVELFSCDIVNSIHSNIPIFIEGVGEVNNPFLKQKLYSIYRCPKCFKTKKVKL